MADDRCRVTVIGDHHQVDLAVPARSPVGEYAARLAWLCGQTANDALPPVWSLAPAGGGPIPVSNSLTDAGISDGQRLYLRDLAASEADEPVVTEVAEAVSDSSQHGQLSTRARAILTAVLGLAWLVTTAAYLIAKHHEVSADDGAAGALATAGVLLPTAVWVLRRRRAPVPPLLSALAALCAIPCLAVAAALLTQTTHSTAGTPIAVACGANIGALLALTATPEAITLAVQLTLAIGGALAAVLAAVHAGPAPSAAAAAVTASLLLALAPRIASTIAGIPFGAPKPPVWGAEVVDAMMSRSLWLLGALTAIPAAALAVALPVLASSPNLFALLLAADVVVALLTRAFAAAFAVQSVQAATVGLIGLFAVLVATLARATSAGWTGPALVSAGVLVACAGFATIIEAAMTPAPDPGVLKPLDPDRRSWASVIGVIASLAILPLAAGVFGAFHEMLILGRHI